MPTVGVDRFEGRGARHIISHTMEMMLVALAVIWGGTCERFPKIRIGFLESGGGWIAPWLDRMDRHFDDEGFNDSGLTTRPSELFERNCWISFEPVEGALDVLADYIGPHKILWATDYPHADGFFPGAPALISRRTALSEATKHEILAGGAIREDAAEVAAEDFEHVGAGAAAGQQRGPDRGPVSVVVVGDEGRGRDPVHVGADADVIDPDGPDHPLDVRDVARQPVIARV